MNEAVTYLRNQRQTGDHWLTRRERLGPWLVLTGIVATAAILVLYGLTRSPVTWDDEVFFTEPARMLASSGDISAPIFFDIAGLNHYFFIQPPVYFLVMAAAYRFIGFNETVARLGSAIPYIAGIVAVFFLARSLASRAGLDRRLSCAAGLLAAFLLAFNEQSVEMARSARGDWFGLLLILAGWLCVSTAARATAHRAMRVAAGFACMLLATVTHIALSGPAAGIILAVICYAAKLGLSRRSALAAAMASAVLVLLPYGVWSFLHSIQWRAQFLHTIGSAGSGDYGSFLRVQVGQGGLVKYELIIVVVIGLGLAVFPWRVSPDAAGAIIGACAVTAASTDPFIKFLLQICLAPAMAGMVLLITGAPRRYRRPSAALAVLASLNAFAFPVLRAYEIHQSYQQRDPMLVTRNIERFVPRGARLIGIPGVYFAAISDGVIFREFRVLYGVQWGATAYLQAQFRRAVERYRPTWFALPLGVTPGREYCYLPDRFRQVSAVDVHIPSILGLEVQHTVAYALWTVASSPAAPAC